MHVIGYEFELLVREGDRPLSKRTFVKFHGVLHERGWKTKYDAGTSGVVGSCKDGFFVTSDDGVCVAEINMPPRETIHGCHEQLVKLVSELQKIYKGLGCSIIGTSVFPGFYDVTNKRCSNVCVDNQCCEKSYIKYINAQRWSPGHHALFIFAANQVWLDVSAKDLMVQWNVFNRLSPILLALFANGPIYNDKPIGVLEGRDVLWRTMIVAGIHGDESWLFGMPPKRYGSVLEYFDDILRMPFYFDLREGKGYKLLDPKITYRDFFLSKQSQGLLFDGTQFLVTPEKSDFWGLQQRTFPHVRIKYKIREDVTVQDIVDALERRDERQFLNCFSHWYLECRALSAQPQSDLSAGAAFLLGLQQKISELKAFLDEQPYAFWLALYDAVQQSGLVTSIEGVDVAELVDTCLHIAERGLKDRGRGEEAFLKPLKVRLEKRQNPAQELLEIWKHEGLAGVFAARDFR
jgi:gamma-glutamylcysteine synthetase